MRLEQDIALLERVADISGKAIWPEPNVSVSEETLRTLREEVEAARSACREYRLIGDEAVFMVQAALRVTFARLDGMPHLEERWKRLGELLRAAVALDLEAAKKSIGEVN